MEKQLFDWEGWDQSDSAAYVFQDVTLKVKIGELVAGTPFKFATLNFETGVLKFGNDDVEFTFNLGLVVL